MKEKMKMHQHTHPVLHNNCLNIPSGQDLLYAYTSKQLLKISTPERIFWVRYIGVYKKNRNIKIFREGMGFEQMACTGKWTLSQWLSKARKLGFRIRITM